MSKTPPVPDHSRPLSCWKSGCRCGAKRISKWQCTKHLRSGALKLRSAKHISKSKCKKPTTFRPLLEAEMFKKCTPLWCMEHCGKPRSEHFGALSCRKSIRGCGAWCEESFEVSVIKTHHIRTTLVFWAGVDMHRTTSELNGQTCGFCSSFKNG